MALQIHEAQRLVNLQTNLQRVRAIFRSLATSEAKPIFAYSLPRNGYTEAGFKLTTDGKSYAHDATASAVDLDLGFDAEEVLLPVLRHLAKVMEGWRQKIIELGGDAGEPIEIPKPAPVHIAVVGDMEMGFQAYGPFPARDTAGRWGCDRANEADGNCVYHILELQAP